MEIIPLFFVTLGIFLSSFLIARKVYRFYLPNGKDYAIAAGIISFLISGGIIFFIITLIVIYTMGFSR